MLTFFETFLYVFIGVVIGLGIAAWVETNREVRSRMTFTRSYDPVEEAYKLLVKIRDNAPAVDPEIEEAIGYLGEALDV